ncbi:MAG: SGNH/GDSL hydrolase family protein [Bdellovibrionales bacterium]|nr:SGNH/GDSL hydrolase family protein [Bdellovibrionales bacterium]
MIWNWLEFGCVWIAWFGLTGFCVIAGRSDLIYSRRVRESVGNLLLVIFSFTFVLFAVESWFFIYPIADARIYSKTASRWGYKYWGEKNSFGYRDREYTRDRCGSVPLLAVIGDSFAAGWGVKDRRERFVNLIRDALEPQMETVLIGDLAWDSKKELDGLKAYPCKPDVVILSYYFNDIFNEAVSQGVVAAPQPTPAPKLLRPLVDHFYLFDFAWTIYDRRFGGHSGVVELIEAAFNSKEVWAAHKQQLKDIVKYTRDNEIKLITVIFPVLSAVDVTRKFAHQVAEVFVEEGIKTIDLSSELSMYSPRQLVVNAFDSHPNEFTNRLVFESLSEELLKLKEESASRASEPPARFVGEM